jgi:hypothetical protein
MLKRLTDMKDVCVDGIDFACSNRAKLKGRPVEFDWPIRLERSRMVDGLRLIGFIWTRLFA